MHIPSTKFVVPPLKYSSNIMINSTIINYIPNRPAAQGYQNKAFKKTK